MANIYEPTAEAEAAWEQWVASRPPAVRAVAEKFRPWKLYRLKGTGHRATVYSFGEKADGTVTLTVTVTGEFNAVVFDRNVFGIPPDELEECELPAPGEPTGTLLTPAEVETNLDELRLTIRPDLWVRMPDGKVVRKGQN